MSLNGYGPFTMNLALHFKLDGQGKHGDLNGEFHSGMVPPVHVVRKQIDRMLADARKQYPKLRPLTAAEMTERKLVERYGEAGRSVYVPGGDEFEPWPERKKKAPVRELVDALAGLLKLYVDLGNSGDAGNWNPEEEPEVIAARAVLAKVAP